MKWCAELQKSGMSHSTHSANYIRVAEAVVLKHHQDSSTLWNRPNSCFEWWTRICSVQRDSANTKVSYLAVLCEFKLRVCSQHSSTTTISKLTQETVKNWTPSLAHTSISRSIPLFYYNTVKNKIPSPSMNLTGSYSRCLISASHKWIAPCLWRRHLRRSAEVQQFGH